MTLYPTKTRRQLVYDIANGLVTRDMLGEAWLTIDGRERKITRRVEELERTGWVTHNGPGVLLTARGEEVVASWGESDG